MGTNTKKVKLNLDALAGKEPTYFTYKGAEYQIITIGEIPFSQVGKFRKFTDDYEKLMSEFNDLEAMKKMISLYVPEFPLDELDVMTNAQIKALGELISELNAESIDQESIVDPK